LSDGFLGLLDTLAFVAVYGTDGHNRVLCG
jgi:hypothetical protein